MAGAATRQLLALHRDGRLAAEYPAVRGLLAEHDPPELVTAGRLLALLDPDEVLRLHPAVPSIRIAVRGHGTLAAVSPALVAELARHGILGRPTLGDFDSYVFDLADPGSDLYASATDLTLCVLDPHVVLDELPNPWQQDDVERVLDEKLAVLERIAATFDVAGTGTLVLNTIPLPPDLLGQLVAHRSRARLGALWREANARLLRLGDACPSLVVLDLDPLLAEGIPVADPRQSVYAKAHLSAQLLARYAREVGHLVRHLLGRGSKCLVVDLDETVWGGVLGDDGMTGIEVADSHRGEAFRGFQRVLRQLGSQGVLLAAVSKNDQEQVRAVLREHPRLTVREEDFVRVSANWRPKSENLADLARDLNIGVDSLVFVDDSPYECGLVRHALPDVAVVRLDDEPALHVRALLRDGWFDTRELTGDDVARPRRYREELARGDFIDSFSSVQDYLDQLAVRVLLADAEAHDVARVSQLTLRTNQFNLTTRRLTAAEVEAWRDDAAGRVLAVHAGDRFGDNGLVGVLLLRREGDRLRIENFLLSCRVFARGIEHACLAAVLRRAGEAGIREVRGFYRSSARNAKVADLYPAFGFLPADKEVGLEADDESEVTEFRHDLAVLPAPPAHVALSERFDLDGSTHRQAGPATTTATQFGGNRA
jgi:FkbH-like protein